MTDDLHILILHTMSDCTKDHLLNIGVKYYSSLPALSRECMIDRRYIEQHSKEETAEIRGRHSQHACQYCGNLFYPGNYTVRVVPKMRISSKVNKLLHTAKDRPWRLIAAERNLVEQVSNRKPALSVKCLTCMKSVERPMFSKKKQPQNQPEVEMAKEVIEKSVKIRKKEVNAGLVIPTSLIQTSNKKSSEERLVNNAEAQKDCNKRKKRKLNLKQRNKQRRELVELSSKPQEHTQRVEQIHKQELQKRSKVKNMNQKQPKKLPFQAAQLAKALLKKETPTNSKTGLRAFLLDVI